MNLHERDSLAFHWAGREGQLSSVYISKYLELLAFNVLRLFFFRNAASGLLLPEVGPELSPRKERGARPPGGAAVAAMGGAERPAPPPQPARLLQPRTPQDGKTGKKKKKESKKERVS